MGLSPCVGQGAAVGVIPPPCPLRGLVHRGVRRRGFDQHLVSAAGSRASWMYESWRCGSARFLSSSSSLQLLRSTAHLTPRARRSQEALQTLRREISLADRVLLYRARPLPAEHEVTAFLTHLATHRHVSASTQNQALSALLFLYRYVLGCELGDLDAVRAKRHRKVPVVLTRTEVQQALEHLQGPGRLVVLILYGSGLRLREGLQLRVKDLDFQYRQLMPSSA